MQDALQYVLACDPYANGRALFCDMCSGSTILSSASALLDHICASGTTALLTGYLIHSHWYTSTEPTHHFWDIHSTVRTISLFEFVSCFRLSDKLTYALSRSSNAFCLDAAVPALTSTWIFDVILDQCIHIRQHNFDILNRTNMQPQRLVFRLS